MVTPEESRRNNKPKLDFFISYSWDDAAVREVVAAVVRECHHDPIFDANLLPSSPKVVHLEILERLQRADVFVVLLTDQSLRSLEVREEMAFAWTWKIPFLVIRDKSAGRDLPWFLRDHGVAVHCDLSDRERGVESLKAQLWHAISSLAKEPAFDPALGILPLKRSIRTSLRQIHSCEDEYKQVQQFRMSVLEQVLLATRTEVQNLVAPEYRQDLSLEHTFIVRAGPIFRSARKVYATSVDQLSRFWTDNTVNAVKYTQEQPDETIRLFVFSNPKAAHQHRQVLAAHFARYGALGAVLLCSTDRYHHFIKESLGVDYPQRKSQFRDTDFGILLFGHGEEAEMFEATLSKKTLECRHIEPESKAMYHRICATFEKAANDDAFRDRFHIRKWKQNLNVDCEWQSALSYVFDRDETDGQVTGGNQDAFHFVFFSASVDQKKLKTEIAAQINALCSLETKDGSQKLIKDCWFGSRSTALKELRLKDPRFLGALRTDNAFDALPYVLVMRLENTRVLQEYYEHREHSKVREKIYSAVDERVERLFGLINNTKDHQTKTDLFDAIESGITRYVVRTDYLEFDDIDWITNNLEPFPFD